SRPRRLHEYFINESTGFRLARGIVWQTINSLHSLQPFPPMSMRTPPRPVTKTGGAMNLVMPLYTIGIVVFFVYTILQASHMHHGWTRRPACAGDSGTNVSGDERSRRAHAHVCSAVCVATGHSRLSTGDLEMEELRRRLVNAEALVQELLLRKEDCTEVPVARSFSPAVGRSIGILVKELTLQSQRQAGNERQQEEVGCCGASSPAHHTDGCLRQRKVRSGPRPTCSCGAPLELTAVQDLESDCDSSGWGGRDSEDDNAEPVPGSNDEEICAECH
ncbi:unnamed protein product, partial [Ixodes hexagonus]